MKGAGCSVCSSKGVNSAGTKSTKMKSSPSDVVKDTMFSWECQAMLITLEYSYLNHYQRKILTVKNIARTLR